MANPMALPEFDAMRRRQQGMFSQQQSQADDALKRRFAMNGMSGSGAFQKAAQLNEQAGQEQMAQGMADIDGQEAQALRQQKDVQEGRAFQTSERTGAERFAAEEAAKGRTFQTGERLGTQQFQTGERTGAQDWQQKQFDFQNKMAQDEAYQNEYNNFLNALIAMKDADFSGQDLPATIGAYEQMQNQLRNGGASAFLRRPR